MRNRDLQLKQYGISPARYRELKYFCAQYQEMKDQISYGVKAISYDGMPKGTKIGNPTEQHAVRNLKLRQDIDLIEQTATEAAPGFADSLLKNVTEGVPYEYLGIVPKGRRQFYEARRYFFYLLSQRK